MPKIDRNSIEDAKNIAELFLKDVKVRKTVLSFLFDSIKYANSIKPDNWNLNLDKNGQFIRFNVGHEFCIEIFKDKTSILCLKKSLKEKIKGENITEVTFKGYNKNQKILSETFENLPDCLSKVPDSVGCYIPHDKIVDYIHLFKKSNMDFIRYGILNTTQLPRMKNAHSIGFIEYLNTCDFTFDSIPLNENRLESMLKEERRKANTLDLEELRAKAETASKIAIKTKISATQFVRNQYVSEYVKKIADGICQDCKNPAPFKNKVDGRPFLESHHIIHLSNGGEDTIENTIALCPNCHRKRHYGEGVV